MRATGIDFLLPDLLEEDLDFFPLAATVTAWETVKRKAKDAQVKGFMSCESSKGSVPTGGSMNHLASLGRFIWACV